jgi:hypothetical protein
VVIKLPDTRVVARAGVNAAHTFFDSNGCVFHEVAQQNDFGKDAYIDIVRDGVLTHLCAAIQIKSGESFRTKHGDYLIPVEQHADSWRRSTVPVFGLIYDPSDALLRWVDLTGYLRAHSQQKSGSVPVTRDAVLNKDSLNREFADAISRYETSSGATIALSLLSVGDIQVEAVFDAWALGRRDARYLRLLRRLILELGLTATQRAILALSHAGDHPDIFWTKDNWIPPAITEQIRPCFRWSAEEIAHMLRAIDQEAWGRGTLGQCFDVLMYEDPSVIRALRAAVGLLLASGDAIAAVRAASLALSHSRDAKTELAVLIQQQPTLRDHEWFQGIAATVHDFGHFSLYS